MKHIFKRISINPQICQGQPTIRGMRIAVSFILKLLASDMSKEDILLSYPELELVDINETIEYASWLASEYYRSLFQKYY